MEEDRSKNTIKSIDNALRILEYMSQKPEGEKITIISKELSLGLTVIHRVLKTLKNRGFIVQDEDTKRYQLGWNARLLGIASLRNSNFFRYGQSFLEELSKITDETTNIVIRNCWEGVYILQVESPNSLRVANQVGNRVPLYCTSAGKILLSGMSSELKQQYYEEIDLPPLTVNTLDSKEKIEEQLRVIKRTNIAYDWEEQAIGETCIATPIFNINGEIVAAISISGPSSRLSRGTLEKLAVPLLETSTRLSEKLGFRSEERGGSISI